MIADDDEIYNYLTKCRQLLLVVLAEEQHSDLREVMLPALAHSIKPRPDKLRQLMHLYHNIVLEVCDWMVYSKNYPHILIETYFNFDSFLTRVDQAIIDECHGIERVWSRCGSKATSLATVLEVPNEHSSIPGPASVGSAPAVIPLERGSVAPLIRGLGEPPLTPPESEKLKPARGDPIPSPETNSLALNAVPERCRPSFVTINGPTTTRGMEPPSPKPSLASIREVPTRGLMMSLFDDDVPSPIVASVPSLQLPRARSGTITDPVSIMVTPSSASPSFASHKAQASPLGEEFTRPSIVTSDPLLPSFPPPPFTSPGYQSPHLRPESLPFPERRPDPPRSEPADVPSSVSISAANSPRIRPISSSGSLSHHWWHLGSRSRRSSATVL